jgi:hypothetical protein
MHTFAQKPKATQQTKPAESAKASPTFSGQRSDMHSIIQLQRMIGNQAVQRLLRTNSESLEFEPSTTAATRFAHDFSRIPAYATRPVRIQPKLTVNARGDIYEQEADRVAKQVMRMPEPQLQRACACGGRCPKCMKEQGGREQLQAKYIEPIGAVATTVPPSAQEATHSHGEALDTPTRKLMEARFGHDFSQVRVHKDNEAARAAHAVQARAYTIGHDIVFGAGQYQPANSEGKLLLAHELTHVVQQRGAGVEAAHRQVDEPPTTKATATPGKSGATERLRAIIADIERVQAIARRNASGGAGKQENGESDSQEQVEKLTDFLEQLREVAGSDDEELKLRVLSGFSSQGLQQAEEKLAEEDTTIREQRPESMAGKAIGMSHPQDAAEIEADRVAQAVVHGSHVRVAQITPGGQVNRQAEAFAAAGATILTLEAESTPLTSWNPPGWVILGVATVVAAALIGTAVYMSRPGNVADTGIMEEVQRLIEAAKAAGAALTVCEALAQLMAAAERARDTGRIQKIKATQKAKGCRHSRHS